MCLLIPLCQQLTINNKAWVVFTVYPNLGIAKRHGTINSFTPRISVILPASKEADNK